MSVDCTIQGRWEQRTVEIVLRTSDDTPGLLMVSTRQIQLPPDRPSLKLAANLGTNSVRTGMLVLSSLTTTVEAFADERWDQALVAVCIKLLHWAGPHVRFRYVGTPYMHTVPEAEVTWAYFPRDLTVLGPEWLHRGASQTFSHYYGCLVGYLGHLSVEVYLCTDIAAKHSDQLISPFGTRTPMAWIRIT